MRHLLINPTVDAQDYIALCGNDAVDFTTDINEATCNECIESELEFVSNDDAEEAFWSSLLSDPASWERSDDERGEPLFI
jgi:hypothetical protein